jgi:hypothetical protein
VHQVGLKDPGSQNFRTLAFKGEAVGVTQIYATTAAATARDGRKFFFRSNNVFFYFRRRVVFKEKHYAVT